MLSLLTGREGVHEDLWLCLLCHACEAICPNAVRVPEIVEELRYSLVDKGLEPGVMEVYLDVLGNILSLGVMMPPVSPEVRNFSEAKELSPRPLPSEVKDRLEDIAKSRRMEERSVGGQAGGK